jgi:hypothetical protein
VPDLRILFSKAKDPGSRDALTCIRSDGSRTWSKLHAAFPIHDMTHYAVEVQTGCQGGFFGLVSQGWDITDFASPEKRARMPLQALWVEHMVGIIWREFVTRQEGNYYDFVLAAEASLLGLKESLDRQAGRQGPRAEYSDEDRSILSRQISENDLSAIRAQIGSLAARWAQTRPGETLELVFSGS